MKKNSLKFKLDKNWDFTFIYPIVITSIFLSIILNYSFGQIESFFYDLRIVYNLKMGLKSPVVLVTIDEESDQFLGEVYPYSFSTHNRFFKKLIAQKPSTIGLLTIPFSSDSNFEQTEMDYFKNQINDFMASGGGFRFGTTMDSWGEELPPNQLQSLGYSLSLLTIDKNQFFRDDICRRAILNISGEDSFHFWISKFHQEKHNLKINELSDIKGAYYNEEADATFTLFQFLNSPLEKDNKINKISYHDVVVGNFSEDFFKDKIVLIGPQYLKSKSDFILTPYNKDYEAINKVPKLNVHGSIIHSLIENATIQKVSRWISNIICVLMSLLMSFIITRFKPQLGILYTLILAIIFLLITWILFNWLGLWIHATHIIITLVVIYYIWVPFKSIVEYKTRFIIEEKNKYIKNFEHLKNNFISLISHDLKTPLAKVSGLVDNLLVGDFNSNNNEKALNDIKQIQVATKELNKFISSILDLVKMESEDVKIQLVSKDLNKIVENVIVKYDYEAKLKNINIKANLGPIYPIKMDLDLVNRIISNLLENAIKYSFPNTDIEINTMDDENFVFLMIKDQGIGIPETEMQNIFTKFYRIKSELTKSEKGQGLGLYLVKYFVQLLGGEMKVDSQLGKGTQFIIKFKY
jgi:signal transduction histidine kinase